MANRFLRPNLIHRFSTVSPVGSPSTIVPETMFLKPDGKTNRKVFHVTQTSDISGPTADPPTKVVPEILSFNQPKPDVDHHLDLSDQARLFASASISDLLRSTVVLHATSIGPMVDLGSWIMSSKLMDTTFTRDFVLRIVKGTFYDHFCAGENAVAAARCVKSLYESTGLKGMLMYGVEHAEDGSACDKNIKKFIETVEAAKTLPTSHLSSVVVKITAICPMSLLKRVSDLLRWQYKNPNFKLPWKLDSFPVLSGLSPLYHTTSEPEPLTAEEQQELEKAHERMKLICRNCQESNVPLLIDAEDTILQPAIDYMAYWSAIMFNSDKDRPIVYNTIQAYLKDAGERLHLALRESQKMNVPIGFKLVRGAYMASEGRLADSLGYKSPVHDTIQETHACYNECMSFLMEKASNSAGIAVVLATHNTDSGKLGARKASELGIDKENGKIEFAQLYGMSDALSFGLKRAGFNVSKYMPYGPVATAVPYLIRRAYENRGMMSTGALDRQLMRMELKRRIMVG